MAFSIRSDRVRITDISSYFRVNYDFSHNNYCKPYEKSGDNAKGLSRENEDRIIVRLSF